MKYTSLLVLTLLLLAGCDRERSHVNESAVASRAESESNRAGQQQEMQLSKTNNAVSKQTVSTQPVSLKDADSANIASQALERKIIRNANLTVEVISPSDSQRKIVSIAESHQGFVVTSEATKRTSEDRTKPEITVNLVVRVPASQFNQVMEEVRGVGARVLQEKVTGQDV